MFSWPANNIRQTLWIKIALTGGGLCCLLALLLTLFGQTIQLHYHNLRLQNELAALRQDPLWQKYAAAEPETTAYPDLETLRALGAEHRLEFISSRSADNLLELVWQGGYRHFLDYLQAAVNLPLGEIIQLDLSRQQQQLEARLILKQEAKNEN